MDVQLRRCIGSTRFGIEAHDAPVSDFPTQPSQKDGLGRMCRSHWTHYTGGLRKAALAKKAAQAAATEPAPEPAALDQDSSSVSLAARLLGAKSTAPYRRDDDDADLDATIEPAKPARAPRAA